jgi:hypothetical protein
MSLSLAVISNALTPLVGKVAAFMQAKGAEVAATAGSMFLALGIILGSHAVSNLHASARQITQATSDKSLLSNKEAHLKMVKQRLLHIENNYRKRCAVVSAGACSAPTGYHHVQNTARALMADLPHYAVRNGVTLLSIAASNDPAQGFSTTPVRGFPGVMQVAFNISGTYTTLDGLRHFLTGLPPSTALTGIALKGSHFVAKVGAYGLTT